MMKIKTFEFLITNHLGNRMLKVCDMDYVKDTTDKVTEPEEIDNTINEFCKGKDIVDIRTNIYTIKTHNNARGNWVAARYTILYDELAK